ncbi:MAG: putative cardiolipin synthase YwiE [Lentisphaerae bacterium ADurb.Bin242]|nr:MAG: putative cardiolipin synthase YwiE [Lentisphaerae bacterium ADurb.Bin242]
MSFEWVHVLFAAGLLAAVAIVILHILFTMRDETERASLWIILVIALPVFGIVLYLFAGISRRNTFGKKISRSVEHFFLKRNAAEHNDLKNYREAISRFIGHDLLEPETMNYNRTLNRLLNAGSPNAPQCEDEFSGVMQGTTSISGNKVELFCDGTDTYPAMLDSIRSARKNINLQTFIFAEDRIGREIMNALIERARAGVDVRVLFDKFGSLPSSWFLLRCRSKHLPNLKIRPFSHSSLFTPWRIQLRNHRKLLIVDGKTVFTGGLNISQENIKVNDHLGIHDFHCRVHGPIVGELQYSFLCDWLYSTKRAPENLFIREYFPIPEPYGDDTVRVIASGHGYIFEGTEKVFFTATSTAEKSIWIITPYFVPSKDFSKALRMASARGVDVRIILPRINNHWYMKMASASFFEPLRCDGVRIFERKDVFTHAKAMLVDNKWAYLGSSNCDIRSFRLNFELDLLVEEGEFIHSLYKQFLRELKNSEELTDEALSAKGPARKIVESACALFTPIL